MANSKIYDLLVSITNGEKPSLYELEDAEPLISDVKYSESNPKKCFITLTFQDEEEYWRLFDVTNDDIWFAKYVFSNYDTFDFGFYDIGQENFRYGYLLQEINEDNIKLLKEILYYISPKYVNLRTDSDWEKVSRLLYSSFKDECDNIIQTYSDERNSCQERGAKKMIIDDTCNAFMDYGIITKTGCFFKYVTSVGILLSLYKIQNDTSLTIKQILSKIGHDLPVTYWGDSPYEVDCIDFDEQSFNREVEWNLEKIYDKVLDGDVFPDIEKYKKFFEKFGKYEMEEWYSLPKNKSITFRIEDVDPTTNMVEVLVNNSQTKKTEKRSYDIDDFGLFLYQYELFEQKKLRYLK